MQHEIVDKSIEFFKKTRYYRNACEAYLKDDIRDHVNAVTLQDKTQNQAQLDQKSKDQNIKNSIFSNKKDNLEDNRSKKKQENAYVKKFMSLMNVHISSYQQKRLIKQKIKRYAIKSNKNLRKTLDFEDY
jgi:hypothetical protein